MGKIEDGWRWTEGGLHGYVDRRRENRLWDGGKIKGIYTDTMEIMRRKIIEIEEWKRDLGDERKIQGRKE